MTTSLPAMGGLTGLHALAEDITRYGPETEHRRNLIMVREHQALS